MYGTRITRELPTRGAARSRNATALCRLFREHIGTKFPAHNDHVLTAPRLVLYVERILRFDPCARAIVLDTPDDTVIAAMRAKGGASIHA